MVRMNLNTQCSVVLTDRGLGFYNNYYNNNKKTNKEVTMSLWEICAVFGEFLYNGAGPVFENNSLNFSEEDLTTVEL